MATADKSESRRCPGEKYTITLAVCEARQANHYPKCLLCKYHGGRGGEGPSSDPKVKTSIFRTTSIAGRVPGEINEYVVRKVGTAAAQFLRAESGAVSSMVVGCDLRENSRNLGRIFCEGANTGGMHTAYVGTVPPEVLRFALVAGDMDSAAFISGCHAAEHVNGIRLYRKTGVPLTFENGLEKIALISRRIKPGRSRAPGQSESLNVMEDYRSYVMKFAQKIKPMKVVLDGSNGIAGEVIPYVFGKLPVELICNHCEPDGRSEFLGRRFPPSEVESGLEKQVVSRGAQLGMAVDFDGDICAFCDEQGGMLRNDVVAALISRELLSRVPGARIAFDLRFTAAVREEILDAGGQPLRSRADPLALAQATRQKEAIYGADMMGRHFFRDMYGSESPVLALVLLCSLVSRTERPLSALADEVRRYSHSGDVRYDLPSSKAVEQVMQEVKAEFPEAERDTLDGLTMRFPNWWFNLRQPSGSASLRLSVEGRTQGQERRGRQMLERIIQKYQAKQSA